MTEATDKIVIGLDGGLGDRMPQSGEAGGPGLSLRTSCDADSDPAVLNAVLDRLTDAYKRQHARAEIERIRDHILGCRRMIENAHLDDAARAEKVKAAKDALQAEMKALEDQVPTALAKEEADWVAAERHGPFTPSDKATSPYGALRKKMREIAARNVRLDLEQADPEGKLKEVIASHEASIVQAEAAIERLQHIVNPPPPERRLKAAG